MPSFSEFWNTCFNSLPKSQIFQAQFKKIIGLSLMTYPPLFWYPHMGLLGRNFLPNQTKEDVQETWRKIVTNQIFCTSNSITGRIVAWPDKHPFYINIFVIVNGNKVAVSFYIFLVPPLNYHLCSQVSSNDF